ncbi:hypothetical protein KY311_01675 [Candidatus Woesearchaeota archaeon]|nr:hypothetical protein [Candidatus Woesearchaeota archaeon]MBW3016931.1 hypothetical protein [Candidatus Woesearchaeota archaeon]
MNEFKRLLFEFAEKSTEILVYSLEKMNVAKMFSGILSIKAKLRKYFAMSVLALAGLIIFMLGLALYVKSIWPKLDNGVGEMIIGAILLVASLIIYQRR